MIILGIESSCDETACAIVENGRIVHASVIASQADLHSHFGGVVPEIASREHSKAITAVVAQALEEAHLKATDLDAIACTEGPGLIGALLVGLSWAKAYAYALDLPLYPVHHIAGHVTSNLLQFPKLEPPFITLVASGGHSHIILVEDYVRYKIIARTRDDAAGEAFDKIARQIGLGYPGGPKIDKEARTGNPHAIEFPRSKLRGNVLDFSFSGVKTSALNFINQLQQEAHKQNKDPWEIFSRNDFAASYQEAIISVLIDHTLAAAQEFSIQNITIAGGVAANTRLKEGFKLACKKANINFYAPDPVLCTDNAMMIASLAYYMHEAGMKKADLDLDARATYPIDSFGLVV